MLAIARTPCGSLSELSDNCFSNSQIEFSSNLAIVRFTLCSAMVADRFVTAVTGVGANGKPPSNS